MRKFTFFKTMLLAVILTIGSGNTWGQATLPFSYDLGKPTSTTGLTQNGLGTDYSASPFMKFDTSGDYLILNFSGTPGTLSFKIKWNQSTSATRFPGDFTLQESSDGSSYTTVQLYNSTNGTALANGTVKTETFTTLNPATRYLKWIYTAKSNGNIALGAISLGAGSSSSTADPTFSPAAGTYTSAQNVTLSSNTSGALIYYTTDGITTPSSSSTLYTGSIALNTTGTTTIKAIAYDASNANPSNVTSATYTINLNPTINSTPTTLSAFSTAVGTPVTKTLTVGGSNLTADIIVALNDESQFQVVPASITQSGGTAAATIVTVTYNPTAAGPHTATLTLSSGTATPVSYSLSGTATWPPLATPVTTAATSITNAGFTANWDAVSGATAYDLNVYTKSGSKTTEGFDAIGTPGTPAPTDWSFTGIGSVYTSSGYFGATSPSVKFDNTNDFITTPTYAAPATAISFWIRGASTDATSALLVEGSTDGSTWNTIENINPLPALGTLKTYNSASSPALAANYIKFRFTYTKSVGNVAFDDFTYTNNYSEDAIAGSPFTGISVTNKALTGLQRGAAYYYRVTAKNTNVTSSISSEMPVMTANNLLTIADGLWSIASTWADGTVPPAGADVVINNNINIDQNVTLSSLTINAGNSLTVNAGKQVTVSTTFTNDGALNLVSDATGTATILTPATIATGAAGTYKIQQYMASTRNWYISSPLGDALMPTGYTFYKYDEPGNNTGYSSPATAYWENVASGTTFSPMAGYLTPISGTSTLEFSGADLNTGTKSINLTRQGTLKTGFNLVGNPYPSYLDWAQASAANTGITPTVWYRTQTSSDVPVFETYNVSGVHTSLGATAVSNRIPPMQAFWVRANTNGATFVVNNTMRTHADFAANSLKAPAMQINKQPALHLIVSNGSNRDEVVFYANDNASNGFDAYDSPKMWNEMNSIPEIYTMVGSEQLAINGMNSIPLNAEFLLGFKTGEANVFNIKASEISNLASDVRVILKDKTMNTEFDLTDGFAYTFASAATFTNGRFSIIFRSGPVTAVPSTTSDQNLLVYRNANNQIAVQIKGQPNDSYSVDVYNSVGKKLVNKQTNTGITVIDAPLSSGVYFVTIKGNGNNTVKKVIID